MAGANLTDIEPMNFDTGVTFDDVGGHQAQIRALQESVLLPLVYPEVFDGFGIEPPRGVLFYGPPGKLPWLYRFLCSLTDCCSISSVYRSVLRIHV